MCKSPRITKRLHYGEHAKASLKLETVVVPLTHMLACQEGKGKIKSCCTCVNALKVKMPALLYKCVFHGMSALESNHVFLLIFTATQSDSAVVLAQEQISMWASR